MAAFVPRCCCCESDEIDPAFFKHGFGAAIFLCRTCADASRWEYGDPPANPNPPFCQLALIGVWMPAVGPAVAS